MLEMVGRYTGKRHIRVYKLIVLKKRLKFISVAFFMGIKTYKNVELNQFSYSNDVFAPVYFNNKICNL
jgi:hypothetical protein